ncbi:RlpA-like double-psi beta-barrel-protein domain-containing protein-containing protein [Chlamydoabsidia padenii]|nr:RlpA-like double-psi beta-barrel-protein domain-containing protein-containing protein [Chlamydoabsidia padenii]
MLMRTSCLMLAAAAVSMLVQVADFAPVIENTLEQRWVDLGADVSMPLTTRDLVARGKKKSHHSKSHHHKKTKPKSKKKKSKKSSPKKKHGSSGGTFKGDGTYYNAGMGSCGKTNTDHDMIAALNAPQMGVVPNPNKNPNCGRYAKVKGPKGTVRVKIVDTCPPCLKGSLDLSPAAFMKIADLAAGRVPITWSWD